MTFADFDPRSELWATGAGHPRFQVRLAIVRAAASCPGDSEARSLLAWAVNDPDDRVAVTALRALGGQRDLAAIDDIFDAAGRSPAALDGVTSGRGDTRRRAVIGELRGLLEAHPDPGEERRRLTTIGNDPRQSLADAAVESAGMVEITGPDNQPFWIDAHPVTWGAYRQFLAAIEAYGPLWRHPGHPASEDHGLVGHLDDRDHVECPPDHPVTGVTWFDAWAYAAWVGKKLPTVCQWELAAGVPLGHRYPWGNDAPTCAHGHHGVAAMDVDAVFAGAAVQPPTAPVCIHPRGATAAGVHDLAGNVWEWTRSRWIDEEELEPFVGVATYPETLGNWTLLACIKGGSWASSAADLEGGARAAKHVLQRGPETGFRCVLEVHAE